MDAQSDKLLEKEKAMGYFNLKFDTLQMSHLMGKPTICIGENKDADQLRGDREADQRLLFSLLR